MTVPAMPPMNLTGGAGGESGDSAGTSNNGLAFNFGTPFNFDSSGWSMNLGSDGNTSTTSGNKDANRSAMTASAVPTASTSTGGLLGALASGSMLPLLVAAVGAFLLLKSK